MSFFTPQISFGDQQDHSLKDYIQASLMLQTINVKGLFSYIFRYITVIFIIIELQNIHVSAICTYTGFAVCSHFVLRA